RRVAQWGLSPCCTSSRCRKAIIPIPGSTRSGGSVARGGGCDRRIGDEVGFEASLVMDGRARPRSMATAAGLVLALAAGLAFVRLSEVALHHVVHREVLEGLFGQPESRRRDAAVSKDCQRVAV